METYEKYLLTEKITISKKLDKLRKRIVDAATPLEYKLAVSQVVQFIKKYKDEYTVDVADELDKLLKKARARAV